MSKEMSPKAKEISRKIDLIVQATVLCSDGCDQSVGAFNQLLSELLNTKLHNASLMAHQNVVPGEGFQVQLSIFYATPGGPVNAVIAKVTRPYPLPTAQELCDMISNELNKQLEDPFSPLLMVLASIRQMESAIVRQNLMRK